MLIPVIKNDEIDFGVDAQELLNAGCAVLTDGYGYVAGKLLIYLIWFVAYVCGAGAACGQYKPFGLALIASRYHTDMVFVFQQVDDVLHVRRFPGTSG